MSACKLYVEPDLLEGYFEEEALVEVRVQCPLLDRRLLLLQSLPTLHQFYLHKWVRQSPHVHLLQVLSLQHIHRQFARLGHETKRETEVTCDQTSLKLKSLNVLKGNQHALKDEHSFWLSRIIKLIFQQCFLKFLEIKHNGITFNLNLRLKVAESYMSLFII